MYRSEKEKYLCLFCFSGPARSGFSFPGFCGKMEKNNSHHNGSEAGDRMRIITVSRQFGSGGREMGKRLADLLGWDYYDREIIQALADKQGLDPDYVRRVLGGHGWHQYQLTYRNSFRQPLDGAWKHTEVLVRQREILEEIAEAGNDCVIVGRDADVVLHAWNPFRVYVCADMESRIERCVRYEERKPEPERLTEKEILQNIRRIDRNRRRTREVLTGRTAGDGTSFDLTVNATNWEIRELAEAVADFSGKWFGKSDEKQSEK